MLRSWLLFHFASGQAFFSGAALILAAVLLSPWAASRRRRQLRNTSLVVGAILVARSATPLPVWGYAVLGLVSIVWLLVEWIESRQAAPAAAAVDPPRDAGASTTASERAVSAVSRHPSPRRGPLVVSRILVAACWIGAVALEVPWHVAPELAPIERPVLAVIADSVTAGIGEDEAVTWPQRLAAEHDVVVHDHSQMGATVTSALRQAARLGAEDNLVLLEIGGNDLLGSTTATQFESGLDRLLGDVCRSGRTVVMFELPLPPTFNTFGRIQRRLAGQHGVVLIPKRLLMGVLCRSDTTLDSIHLSQAGHDELAAVVWAVIEGAFPTARKTPESVSP